MNTNHKNVIMRFGPQPPNKLNKLKVVEAPLGLEPSILDAWSEQLANQYTKLEMIGPTLTFTPRVTGWPSEFHWSYDDDDKTNHHRPVRLTATVEVPVPEAYSHPATSTILPRKVNVSVANAEAPEPSCWTGPFMKACEEFLGTNAKGGNAKEHEATNMFLYLLKTLAQEKGGEALLVQLLAAFVAYRYATGTGHGDQAQQLRLFDRIQKLDDPANYEGWSFFGIKFGGCVKTHP